MKKASSDTLFWSRVPGKFVNKYTGKGIKVVINGKNTYQGPKFTGTVHEWYQTLIETLIDARNYMFSSGDREMSRVYVSNNIRVMLEATVLFKHSIGSAPHVGTIGSMFKVFIDDSLQDNIVVKHNGKTMKVKVLDCNIFGGDK